MERKHWISIGLLAAALGLSACGNRPGRDDEVLFTNAYPDLASVPEDQPRSRAVNRQTRRLYDDFQAVSNDPAVLAVDFQPLLAEPVMPPRSIIEARQEDRFNTLQLNNDTASALLMRQQQSDAYFGIEAQIAQDALDRARAEQQKREQQEAREAAIKEFEERRAEQIRLIEERRALEAALEMEPQVEVAAGPQRQPGSLADLFFDTSVGDPVSIVYFDPESAALGERELAILRPIAGLALQNKQTLILHGHTNGYRFTRTQQHRDYHMEQSRRRTLAVRDKLVELGVPAENIKTQWFGDLRPVWAEVNGMTSQGNRRVEIFVEVPERLLMRESSLSASQ